MNAMKIKCILLVVVMGITFGVSPGQEMSGIGKVSTVKGKEVYILNKPLRPYKVVLEVNAGPQATSVVTGGMINEGVSKKTDQFLRKAEREAKREEVDYDALLYQQGKKAEAIKFIGDDEDNAGLAKVSTIESVQVYIRCEPVTPYRKVKTGSGGIKAKSYLSGGLINNSIEEDVKQYIRILQKSDKSIEGIIYTSGKKATGVVFEQEK